MSSFNAVIKTNIKDLINDNINSVMIVGIVINKSEYHKFSSKLNDGEMAAVITFTVRDSVKDFINCVVWGSEHFVEKCNDTIRIHSILVINSPTILLKTPTETDRFNPITSSPYTLKVTEKFGSSSIYLYEGDDRGNFFHRLKNEPFKSIDSILSLIDVKSFTTSCLKQKEYVNLLVAIRYMKPVREIITKKGPKSYREIIVMDQTLPGMSLSIWNAEYIHLSENWVTHSTVLFLSDVRVDFSEYLKSIALNVSSRTIILENPTHPNAEILKQYANNAPVSNIDFDNTQNGTPDLATITNVMTVQKIYDHAENSSESDEEQFTALVYAMITRLDIDGDGSRVICRRCSNCRYIIRENLTACNRESCVGMELISNQNPFSKCYDISVDLSDHTGTLTGCHLMGLTAERFIGYGLDVFEIIGELEKNELKWKYLLKRGTVKLLIKKKTVCRPRHFISILDLRLSTMDELANKIKLY